MFARSIAVLGAASVFAVAAGADADARGKRRGCCQTTTCYQKVMTPPVYKTVMVKVMVQPQRCTLVATPPVYRTEQQHVVVEPARQVVHSQPAVYGRVQETVQVRAGYTRWKRKRSRGCCGVEYRCAVTVPPKFATRTRRVEVQPATHWVETKPAVMGVVNRQVMVSPGTSRRVCQPAVYQMVPKQVMVSPATVHWAPAASTCGQPAVLHQQPVVVPQPVPVHHRRHISYK